MQHSTYHDTTFHPTPYSTYVVFRLHSTSHHVWNCNILHHISHRTIIHIKSHHHISAHHSTSGPHSTSHHAMNIAFKYRLQITIPQPTFQTTPHIPYRRHAAFQPSFRITPLCLIRRHTIQCHSVFHNHISFTSCISTPPYSPCTTLSFHIVSPHFTTHLHIAQHHT